MKKTSKPAKSTQEPRQAEQNPSVPDAQSPPNEPPNEPPSGPPPGEPAKPIFQALTLSDADIQIVLQRL